MDGDGPAGAFLDHAREARQRQTRWNALAAVMTERKRLIRKLNWVHGVLMGWFLLLLAVMGIVYLAIGTSGTQGVDPFSILIVLTVMALYGTKWLRTTASLAQRETEANIVLLGGEPSEFEQAQPTGATPSSEPVGS